MNLDRTSIPDRTHDLRTQKPQPNEATELPQDSRESTPTTAPQHGGALASSSLAKEPDSEQNPEQAEQQAERRRQEAYEAINRHLQIPGGTELDIRVDAKENQVTFQIRDRNTGEVLREVPESESGSLVDELRDYTGTLINRSL